MPKEENFNRIMSLITVAVIPVALLMVGNNYTESLKDKEIHGKLVEVAINILDKPPAGNDSSIRRWATRVIDKYSGVPFGDSVQKDLIENVPLNVYDSYEIPRVYKDIKIPKDPKGPLRIENDLLVGENITYPLSPNTNDSLRIDPHQVKAIVIHVLEGTIAGSVSWFRAPVSKVSTHLIIGKNGTIVQVIPFNFLAFHAGRVEPVKDDKIDRVGIFRNPDGSYEDPNKVTIGIELEGNQMSKFTDQQLASCRKVCQLIKDQYHVKTILTHHEIYSIKTCPGPNFPIGQFRKELFGQE